MGKVFEKVFEKSNDFKDAAERCKLVKALIGGTPAMIAAGTEYLPKQSAEHFDDYQIRLKSGYLYNGYKRTRNYLTGLVWVDILSRRKSLQGFRLSMSLQACSGLMRL